MDTHVHMIRLLNVISPYILGSQELYPNLLFMFVIKEHSGQKQLAVERVCFRLQISTCHLGKPGQELKA